MKSLFSLDSPFFKWLNILTDLFVLNILWILCSIPIVTIGASTSAMYNVTIKMVKNEDAGIAKTFFKAFRNDFRQATIRLLILAAAALVLLGDYIIVRSNGGPALYVVLTFGIVLWLFVESYTFPLTAYFDNTHKNTFKNAFFLSIIHFPRTILIVVLKLSPVLIALASFEVFYRTSFIWILFGWALIAYINSFIYRVVFEKITR